MMATSLSYIWECEVGAWSLNQSIQYNKVSKLLYKSFWSIGLLIVAIPGVYDKTSNKMDIVP